MGLALLLPLERMPGPGRTLGMLLALGGIVLAVTSFAFLFLSEHQPLFGFMDYGYRPAIIAALAAEATTAALLIAYLGTLLRRRLNRTSQKSGRRDSLQIARSRRADSNRGPLHYE
jgi:hypothetical protein